MKTSVLFVHILISIILTGLILLQTSKGGLGSAFGGGEFYRSKRGAERMVFIATIATALIFLSTSIVNVLMR